MRDHKALEQVVLGGMMNNAAALQDGLNELVSSHFRLPSHQVVFEAIVALQRSGEPIELLPLKQHLDKQRQLRDIGGFGYLVDLANAAVDNQDIRHYIGQVRESSGLYRLSQLCERVMIESAQGDRSSLELIADLEASLHSIQEATQPDEMTTMQELVPTVVDRILRPEARPLPMPTGIAPLDTLTMGGIRPGELWVWGGLPGRAKSAVARQVARSIASKGWPADIFTIEMPEEDWVELDLAAISQVSAWKIRMQTMNREERKRVVDAGEKMMHWPMRYEDSGSLNLRTLIAKSRISVMRRQTKLVVVDYVQRVKTNDKEPRIRVGNVAEALAEFAKEYKCAVVLLSQLARKGDINQRPSMQDLKEAGELEAHAHCVLLNFRPVNKDSSSETVEEFIGLDEIIVAKQRNGPMGSVRVAYNPDFLLFEGR